MGVRPGWGSLVSGPGRERGASLVVWALSLFMLFAFTTLALDGGNLYVARAEVQNAADAGALAGARFLYTDGGLVPNPDAAYVAEQAARANRSQGAGVEVDVDDDDVRLGHWTWCVTPTVDIAGVTQDVIESFPAGCGAGMRGYFTPVSPLPTEPPDLFRTTTALNADTGFVNAVEVVTFRDATPVQAFFGRFLGYQGYRVSARAVAWLGFAGTLDTADVDWPVGICRDKIFEDDGSFNCSIGTFVPSNDTTYSESGGWTDFNEHPDTAGSCDGGTDANALSDLFNEITNEQLPTVCSGMNPNPLTLGYYLSTSGGQAQSVFDLAWKCWLLNNGWDTDNYTVNNYKNDPNYRPRLWSMTLPVFSCWTSNVGPCERLRGAVNVNVVWVNPNGINENVPGDDAPEEMWDADGQTLLWQAPSEADWQAAVDSGQYHEGYGAFRWDSFVAHFNIKNPAELTATFANDGWQNMTLYFLPDCELHEPTGVSGGENFGVIAKVPRLVQ